MLLNLCYCGETVRHVNIFKELVLELDGTQRNRLKNIFDIYITSLFKVFTYHSNPMYNLSYTM